MSWTSITLGEYFKETGGLIQTGPFGSSLHQKDYKSEGNPVIMPKDIVNDKVNITNIARIGQDDWIRLQKYAVRNGDIVYPRRGEITKRVLISIKEEDMLCGTGCILIRNKSIDLDNLFLNYYLTYKPTTDWLENNAVGSTMKNLSGAILSKLPLIVPPLPTQKRIASILSAYDDSIENNLKRIKLLEETAQNIYKEWFVHFRFPNYEHTAFDAESGLPVGWEMKIADDIYNINIGKTPPRLETQWFSREDGVKWVSIADMNKSSVFISQTNERITKDGVHKFNMRMANEGSVLLSFKLTVGAVVIASEEVVTNEAIAHFNILENSILSKEYTYCFLKSFNYQSLGSTSSIGTSINSKIVKSMKIVFPTENVISEFTQSVEGVFKQIKNLTFQNQKLKEARDILLPRLMNRAIEV
jgi:type I restriction enzyme S subunit